MPHHSSTLGIPVSASVGRIATARLALVGMVAVSTVVHIAVALAREIPRYLPDEFLYPQLARSLASGDGISILGQPTAFPALLEPLLTAPIWAMTDDTAAAIALTQCLHALLMSLAAVPVYVLSRTLGLPERTSLACAAITLIVPGVFFASFLSADSLGLLLALTSIAVCVHVLARPSWAGELAALASVGLATFARIQYAFLLPALGIAALAAARFSPRAAVRTYPIVAGVIVVGFVLSPYLGVRLLGRYEAVTGFVPSSEVVHWLFSGGFLLALATGVAIVPGAVAWAGHAIVRSGDPSQRAFAALGLSSVGATLVMTSLLTVETGSDRFIERYLIVAAPLTAVAFACWLEQQRPAPWVAIGVSLVLAVVAMRLTLSQFAVGQGVADSPTLFALSSLERVVDVGTASLAVAAGITLGVLVAIGLALGRVPAAFAWLFAAAAFALIGAGAVSGDRTTAESVRTLLADGSPDWIDRRGVSDVLLVQSPGSERFDAMLTSVMNRSVTEAASLGRTRIQGFDGLVSVVALDGSGRLIRSGSPIRQPVAFATGGTAAAFTGATRTTYDRSWVLVEPRGSVRLSMLADGVRSSGRLSQRGELRLFGQADGRCTRLTLRLSIPRELPATVLEFSRRGAAPAIVRIQPGSERAVSWTSGSTAETLIRFRTLRLGGEPPGPFVATVANVGWSVTPSDCAPGVSRSRAPVPIGGA